MRLLIVLFLVPATRATPLSWFKHRWAAPDPAVVRVTEARYSTLEYVPGDSRERLDRLAAVRWANGSHDPAARRIADRIELHARAIAEAQRVDQRFFAEHALSAAYNDVFALYQATTGSALTFERVFAGPLAELTAGLARRWGVDLARAETFVEHALPGEGPRAPRRYWASALAGESSLARVPYAEARRAQLIEGAREIAPELAQLMLDADSTAERRSAIAAHLGFRFDPRARHVRFALPTESTNAEAIDIYRAILDRLDQERRRLYSLEPSPMKESLWRDLAELYYEAREELALLPLRRNPPASLVDLPLDDPRWWNFGVSAEDRPAPLARVWFDQLTNAGLKGIARMIDLAPPAPALGCREAFTDAPSAPAPVVPVEIYRRFGPELM